MLTVFKDELYLSIEDGINGSELWKLSLSNSLSIVKDVNVGSGSATPVYVGEHENYLYFTAFDELNKLSVWKTNGKSYGTVIAAELPFNNCYGVKLIYGTYYFFHTDYNDYYPHEELWKTNGTPAGTSLVKKFDEDAGIYEIFSFKGKYCFFVSYFGYSGSFWSSDGTEAGTVGLTVNYPDTYLGKLYSGKDHLAFYLSVAGVGASNLFYYDGNSISNFWLQNFDPRKFAIAGDKLFFSDHIDAEYGYPAEPDNYYQLFQSDFTIQGTKAVKNIGSGGGSFAGSDDITAAGEKIFFTTYNDGVYNNTPDEKKRLYVCKYKSNYDLREDLSFNSQEDISEFSIFPNPSSSVFHFQSPVSDELVTLQIFDSKGKQVESISGNAHDMIWSGEKHEDGIYLYKYSSPSWNRTGKLILSK
ncbi:MAG: T9SS type A sorting domain-containing protein [Sporocytophaga sp.]|nr:T9SS type A sorting domain-containing protein [Sporocytophaga sp.]